MVSEPNGDLISDRRNRVFWEKGLRGAKAITMSKEVRRLVNGKLDKTYRCNVCGQEVRVTKEGVGVLVCCNKPMEEL